MRQNSRISILLSLIPLVLASTRLFASNGRIGDILLINSGMIECDSEETPARCLEKKTALTNQLNLILTQQEGLLDVCYQKNANKGDGSWGEIIVSFELDVSGKIVDLVSLENSTGSEKLDICVHQAIKAGDFDDLELSSSLVAQVPIYFDSEAERGAAKGTAMIALSLGQMSLSGDFKADELTENLGFLAEIGTSDRRHNLMLSASSSKGVQSSDSLQTVADAGSRISLGYQSMVYRYCGLGWGLRPCFGLGAAVLKLTGLEASSSGLVYEDKSFSGLPVHLSFSKTFGESEPSKDSSRSAYEMSLAADYLDAGEVKYSRVILGLGLRFLSQ